MLKYIRFAFDNVLSKVNYVNGWNNFNNVTFVIDDVLKRRKNAENVGKYLVTKETEETPKTACTGNQPWAAVFVENILNTRETEDTLQKTTCVIAMSNFRIKGGHVLLVYSNPCFKRDMISRTKANLLLRTGVRVSLFIFMGHHILYAKLFSPSVRGPPPSTQSYTLATPPAATTPCTQACTPAPDKLSLLLLLAQ